MAFITIGIFVRTHAQVCTNNYFCITRDELTSKCGRKLIAKHLLKSEIPFSQVCSLRFRVPKLKTYTMSSTWGLARKNSRYFIISAFLLLWFRFDTKCNRKLASRLFQKVLVYAIICLHFCAGGSLHRKL